MKKISLLLALVFAAASLLLGCSSASASTNYNYDLSPYVTLGQYKGIQVAASEAPTVTDEEVEQAIQQTLADNATQQTVTDRPVQAGDTINIDFNGTIDGQTFDGGTDTGQEIVVGEAGYIDGFENGLIGANTGETRTLNLTFPADYDNADLAGKAAVFAITVNSISAEQIPTLSDAFVQTISDCATVDAYRQSVRDQLLAKKQDQIRENKQQSVWTSVVNNAEILGYPEQEIERTKQEMTEYYTSYAQAYGMEFADFLTNFLGMTEEEFQTEAAAYAQELVGQELVLYAIIGAENLELSQEEYRSGLDGYAKDAGYDSSEEYETDYGKDWIFANLLQQKALNFITEAAEEVQQA